MKKVCQQIYLLVAAFDESPTTNTPEKFAHLDTKLKKENHKRQLKNFCDFLSQEKEIQQLDNKGQ